MTAKMKQGHDLKQIEQEMHQILMHQAQRAKYQDGAGVFARTNVVDEAVHDGIALYARLIANGRRDLFSSIYPLTETLLGKKFASLIEDFRESNKAPHYNFNRQAQGLADFVRSNQAQYATRYPFLPDLLRYEWLELQVMEHEDDLPEGQIVARDADTPQQYAARAVNLNPTLQAVDFAYPIQDLIESIEAGDKLPRRFKKSPCHLVFLRDRDDDVRVMQLGPIARTMVAQCQSGSTIGQLLIAIMQDPDLAHVHGGDLESLLCTIDDLHEMQAIYLT